MGVRYEGDKEEFIVDCMREYKAVSPKNILLKLGLAQYDKYPEFDCFRGLKGPDSMGHRYVREDATVGNSIMLRLGSVLEVEMPTMRALITIAGAVNSTDYFSAGLTLEELGISGSTPDDINGYLLTGKSV